MGSAVCPPEPSGSLMASASGPVQKCNGRWKVVVQIAVCISCAGGGHERKRWAAASVRGAAVHLFEGLSRAAGRAFSVRANAAGGAYLRRRQGECQAAGAALDVQ